MGKKLKCIETSLKFIGNQFISIYFICIKIKFITENVNYSKFYEICLYEIITIYKI